MSEHIYEGFVPKDESGEELLTWFDPYILLHGQKGPAIKQWGEVKKVRIKVIVEEIKPNCRKRKI